MFPNLSGVTDVIHKGIQYSIAATDEPDIWRWQFEIGDAVRSGKTQTRLAEHWPPAGFNRKSTPC